MPGRAPLACALCFAMLHSAALGNLLARRQLPREREGAIDCSAWPRDVRIAKSTHKSGVVMLSQLKGMISTLCGVKYDERRLLPNAIFGGKAWPPPRNASSATRRPQTLEVFSLRDPFMLVASGMLYHRAASEPWTTVPMSSLIARPQNFGNYAGGVWQAAQRDPTGLLPRTLPNESYASYLRRLDESTAILAEMVRTAGFAGWQPRRAQLDTADGVALRTWQWAWMAPWQWASGWLLTRLPRSHLNSLWQLAQRARSVPATTVAICIDELETLTTSEYQQTLADLLSFWRVPEEQSMAMARELTPHMHRRRITHGHGTGSAARSDLHQLACAHDAAHFGGIFARVMADVACEPGRPAVRGGPRTARSIAAREALNAAIAVPPTNVSCHRLRLTASGQTQSWLGLSLVAGLALFLVVCWGTTLQLRCVR